MKTINKFLKESIEHYSLRCFLQCNGEFLLMKSNDVITDKEHWFLPGITIDGNEDSTAAAYKVCKNQLGINIEGQVMQSIKIKLNNNHSIKNAICFIINFNTVPEIEIQDKTSGDGYSDYKWITKSQFDKFYKNITGDAEVIEKIYKDIIK